MPYCPLCAAPRETLWYLNGYWRCRGCRGIIRDPIPTEEELNHLYETSWKTPTETDAMTETGGTTPALANAHAHHLTRALGRQDLKGVRILEFGAGRGEIVRATTALGAEVTPVEPYGWEYLRRAGYNAHASLTEVPTDTPFDGVVSTDVIEHLRDPEAVFKDLVARLRPGGWLFVKTANANSLRARREEREWREIHNLGHLILFTPMGMEQLLHRCGLERLQSFHWFLPYSGNRVKDGLRYLLALLRLGGEMIYLGWKPSG